MVGKKKRSNTVSSRKSSSSKAKPKPVKKNTAKKLKVPKPKKTRKSIKNLDKNVNNDDLLKGSVFKTDDGKKDPVETTVPKPSDNKKPDLDDLLGKPPLPSSADDKDLPDIPTPSKEGASEVIEEKVKLDEAKKPQPNLESKPVKIKKGFLSGLFGGKKKADDKLDMPDVDSVKSMPHDPTAKDSDLIHKKDNLESRKIMDRKKEEFFDGILKEHQSKKSMDYKKSDKIKVSSEEEMKLRERLKKDSMKLDSDESKIDSETKIFDAKLDKLKDDFENVEKKKEDDLKNNLKKDLDILNKDGASLDKEEEKIDEKLTKPVEVKSKALKKSTSEKGLKASKEEITKIDNAFEESKIEKPSAEDFMHTGDTLRENFDEDAKKEPEKPKLSEEPIKEKPKKGLFGGLFGKKETKSNLDLIDDSLKELGDVPETTISMSERKPDINHEEHISKLKEPKLLEKDIKLKNKKQGKIKAGVKKELSSAVDAVANDSFLANETTAPEPDKTSKFVELVSEKKLSAIQQTEQKINDTLSRIEDQASSRLEKDDALEQRMARLEKDESAMANREEELNNIREELRMERERFEADRVEFEEKLQGVSESAKKNQNIRMLQLTIEKLKEREAQQMEKLSRLNNQINEKTSDFDSKTKKLVEWEDRLSAKERELDERENVLLTMQTDLIRERRELDDKEFSLYMKEELAQLPSKMINQKMEAHQEQLRHEEELSPKNFQIYGRINQTKELLANGHVHDAKINYNRVVQDFQALQANVEEKKKIHLQVLELYNEIHIAELNEPAQNQKTLEMAKSEQ
jgi:hypothetical protein